MGKELHTTLDKGDKVAEIDDAFKKSMSTLIAYHTLLQNVGMGGDKAFVAHTGMDFNHAAQAQGAKAALDESLEMLREFDEKVKEAKKPGKDLDGFPKGILSASAATPTLGRGGAVAGQDAHSEEQIEKDMAELPKLYADALTPQQTFARGQDELNATLKDATGKFYAGAEGAKAYEEALRRLTDVEMKELEASRKATDGIKAFWMELQHDGSENGKFAFDFLNTMFKDIEDGAAKTILARGSIINCARCGSNTSRVSRRWRSSSRSRKPQRRSPPKSERPRSARKSED
jgi:hypothetical protein